MTDESGYVWDLEWSHLSFLNIPIDISSQAITIISINRHYVRINPLFIDATPLNYNSSFTDRTGNKRFNGTRNLTQQDIQNPSHFVNDEVVEIMPTTTQQSFSPIHPTLITPRNKNAAFLQTTMQSTVKTFVIPKHSQMDYQTFEPVTTSRQTNKQKTSNRNNFSDHNYNFFCKNPKQQNPLK